MDDDDDDDERRFQNFHKITKKESGQEQDESKSQESAPETKSYIRHNIECRLQCQVNEI